MDIGNQYYHVLNRANARLPIFKKEKDFEVFEKILEEAKDKYSMRVLAYCLMPNHWHFILQPSSQNRGSTSILLQSHTQI